MAYVITSTKLDNIADAVRYKCSTNSSMNISTMVYNLSQLQQSNGIIDVSQSSGATALSDAVSIATFNPLLQIIDTSTMTSMRHMFSNWPNSALDLKGLITSSVTDMAFMFDGSVATSLTHLNYFDTRKVTNMQGMFQASAVGSIDLSSWDTSSVTNMSAFFYGSAVRSIDVSSWDTSSVANMSLMFYENNLRSIDLSDWDTSNVTNMQEMFKTGKGGTSTIPKGKIWIPSTFVAHNVSNLSDKPFNYAPYIDWDVYTDATDAESQGWGQIYIGESGYLVGKFIMHYNSTHQDFLNA